MAQTSAQQLAKNLKTPSLHAHAHSCYFLTVSHCEKLTHWDAHTDTQLSKRYEQDGENILILQRALKCLRGEVKEKKSNRNDIYTGDVMATSAVIHSNCSKKIKTHTHTNTHSHSPVNADSAQVENTGGAHHHIQRDKDVTVEPAEKPGSADHLQRTDRQINDTHVSPSFSSPSSQSSVKCSAGDKEVSWRREKMCTQEALWPKLHKENQVWAASMSHILTLTHWSWAFAPTGISLWFINVCLCYDIVFQIGSEVIWSSQV